MISSTREPQSPELCSWQLVKKGNLTFKYFGFKVLVFFFMVFTLANWNLWDRLTIGTKRICWLLSS